MALGAPGGDPVGAEGGVGGIGAVAQAEQFDVRDVTDPVGCVPRRPDPGRGAQLRYVVPADTGGAEEDQVGEVATVRPRHGQPADHRAVAVAQHGRGRGPDGGQAGQEAGQPRRAGIGEPAGHGVRPDADGCGVSGPGDDRGTGPGRIGGQTGPQRPGHAGRCAVRVPGAVEGAQVDVRAGHDHGGALGGRQVAVHLGHLAAAAGIEGEDVPAGESSEAQRAAAFLAC